MYWTIQGGDYSKMNYTRIFTDYNYDFKTPKIHYMVWRIVKVKVKVVSLTRVIIDVQHTEHLAELSVILGRHAAILG